MEAEGGPSIGFAKIPIAPQAIQTTPSTKQIHCPITVALAGASSIVVLSAFCFALDDCLENPVGLPTAWSPLLPIDLKYVVNVRPVFPEAIGAPLPPEPICKYDTLSDTICL